MRFLGIDPDLNGGFAVVNPDTQEILKLCRVPVFEPPLNKPRRLDAVELHGLLLEAVKLQVQFVVLEVPFMKPHKGPHGMTPPAGVHTANQTYGGVRTLSEAVFGRGRVATTQASVWKKDMGVTSDKDTSLTLAAKLYPSHATIFGVKKNDGLAEAVLLATYGKNKCT